ncbi:MULTISPECIES: hypothetical protein [unclassified Bradyrhizobium]|uniref:hypothetical protein n=1 Tax=unclassified Bradyrhizobium TaxID=2631580 RepID=UPI002FF0396D
MRFAVWALRMLRVRARRMAGVGLAALGHIGPIRCLEAVTGKMAPRCAEKFQNLSGRTAAFSMFYINARSIFARSLLSESKGHGSSCDA